MLDSFASILYCLATIAIIKLSISSVCIMRSSYKYLPIIKDTNKKTEKIIRHFSCFLAIMDAFMLWFIHTYCIVIDIFEPCRYEFATICQPYNWPVLLLTKIIRKHKVANTHLLWKKIILQEWPRGFVKYHLRHD